jgi:hypothetical protein
MPWWNRSPTAARTLARMRASRTPDRTAAFRTLPTRWTAEVPAASVAASRARAGARARPGARIQVRARAELTASPG